MASKIGGYVAHPIGSKYDLHFYWDKDDISKKMIKYPLDVNQIYVNKKSKKSNFFVLIKDEIPIGIFYTILDLEAFIFPTKLGHEGYSRNYCTNTKVEKKEPKSRNRFQWYDDKKECVVRRYVDNRFLNGYHDMCSDVEGTILDPNFAKIQAKRLKRRKIETK